MSTQTAAAQALRDQILADPAQILDDPELMTALIAADEGARGGNVVDLRGLALSRLEARLSQLEATHQDVIAAAYANVSTTAQVHRALLAMVRPLELEPFLRLMGTEVADILRVSNVRLLLEPAETRPMPDLPDPFGLILPVEPGLIEAYMDQHRAGRCPDVVLRRVAPGQQQPEIHRPHHGVVGSEALIRLELGRDFPAGLLVLGAEAPDQYQPSQATDLIELFGRVFERCLRALLP